MRITELGSNKVLPSPSWVMFIHGVEKWNSVDEPTKDGSYISTYHSIGVNGCDLPPVPIEYVVAWYLVAIMLFYLVL